MQTLAFSENWNEKLRGKCFTTFRASSRFKVGERIAITLKGQPLDEAEILDVKPIKLSKVNEWIARLDTGYSLDEFKKIVHNMYKNKIKDIENHTFYLYLIKRG